MTGASKRERLKSGLDATTVFRNVGADDLYFHHGSLDAQRHVAPCIARDVHIIDAVGDDDMSQSQIVTRDASSGHRRLSRRASRLSIPVGKSIFASAARGAALSGCT